MKKITFLLFTLIPLLSNAQQKLTSSVDQFFNGISWENTSKAEYIYDSSNLVTREINFSWDKETTTWVESGEIIYAYNSNGKLTSETDTFEYFDGTMIVEEQNRTNYIYDANNNLIELIEQEYNGTTFVNDLKTELIYINNRIAEFKSFIWDDAKWVDKDEDAGKGMVTYNSNGDLSTTLSFVWNGTTFENDFRNLYTYNSSNRLIKSTNEEWNGNAWEESSKEEYGYDVNGNVISEKSTYKDDGNTSSETNTYTFDTTILMDDIINPFEDTTGIEYFGEPDYYVNKLLSSNSQDFRTVYNYNEATANTSNFSLIEVSVTPNPTTDLVTISGDNLNVKNVSVYNVTGKQVAVFNNLTFSVKNFVNGIYILKIETKNRELAIKKIVKN